MKGKIFSSQRHHHSMHPWILTFKFLKCLHFYDGYVSTPKHKLQMIDSQPPRMLNQKKTKKQIEELISSTVFYSFCCLFIFLFGASLSTPGQRYPALSLRVETVDDGSKVWWLQHLSNFLRNDKNPKGTRLGAKKKTIIALYAHVYDHNLILQYITYIYILYNIELCKKRSTVQNRMHVFFLTHQYHIRIVLSDGRFWGCLATPTF